MREIRYKPVLNREEMCVVFELLHNELMRYNAYVKEQIPKFNPSDVWEAHMIEKMEDHLSLLRKLKAKFGAVR